MKHLRSLKLTRPIHRAVALSLASMMIFASGILLTQDAHAVSTSIVISEFRTRGLNGALDEFIELRNISNEPVNIQAWEIRVSSTNGTASNRIDVDRSTIIKPGCRFLIVNVDRNINSELYYSGGTTWNASYIVGIADNGGIALLNDLNQVVDQVGMSSGSFYKEGTPLAPLTQSINQSYERKPAGTNTTDTDDNSADFSYNNGTSTPQYGDPTCVTVGAAPTPPPATATPTTPPGPTPTVGPTIVPTVTTPVPAPNLTPIYAIQGAAHRSPLVGQQVTTSGVVTAVRSNGFYIQNLTPDADPATSEGIFVFTSSRPGNDIVAGVNLEVRGTVSEFRPGGSSGLTNLSLTQLTNAVITALPGTVPQPAGVVIGAGGRVPPTTIIDDDATGDVEAAGTFDAATDGIDFYESLEGMLVQVNDAVAVGPTSDFGEIPLLGDNGAAASIRTIRGGIVISDTYADFNPERIILDDAITSNPPAMNVGDRFAAPVTGIMDYSFNNYKLLATGWPEVTSGGLIREVAPLSGIGELSIGTFNVENLEPGDGDAKFNALAAQIVNHLRAPDILALEEVQDNNGATNDAVVAADQTYTKLIAAITAAGGPTYQYRQIDPTDDADGGEPGGNIRVGFLFRTDRGLSFVERAGGDATTDTDAVASPNGGVQLTHSPGRLSPDDAAFAASRKPLVGEFNYRGQTVIVVANHFSSKGGDQPLFGRFQPPTRSTEVKRIQQAAVVAEFVKQALAISPNAMIAVVGDLNDFEFSPAVTVLKQAGMTALVETLPKAERYTYVFEGNSQVLDHTLVTEGLRAKLTQYDIVHVNAEYVEQTSDHDPQVAFFGLGPRLIFLPIVQR